MKILRFLGGLVGPVCGATSEKSVSQALSYLRDHYIAKETSQEQAHKDFCHIYGTPSKTPFVLVAFTSMACPVCAEFHHKVLPQVLEKEVKQGKLAVIIRDYPADPLSLRVSAMVWAYPELSQKIMQKLFSTSETWNKGMEKDALNHAKSLVKEEIKDDVKRKYLDESTGDRPLLQKIFNQRIGDKQNLNITEVPTLWLISKDRDQWELQRLQLPLELQTLQRSLQ